MHDRIFTSQVERIDHPIRLNSQPISATHRMTRNSYGALRTILHLDLWLHTSHILQLVEQSTHVPEGYVAVESMMTIDTSDNLHILVSGVDPVAVGDESHWGHPSSEVFYLRSSDKSQSFTCDQISPNDPETASWLPSISRPGPFHPVKKPIMMYTHGSVGSGTTPNIQTEVWCLMIR